MDFDKTFYRFLNNDIFLFLVYVSLIWTTDKENLMDVKYRKTTDGLTVYVFGELDEYTASKTKDILDKLIYDNANSKKFIFDLSGVSFMDSTGIGLLIGRYKKLKQFNVPAYISGASVSTEKVLSLAGIYSIMPKF